MDPASPDRDPARTAPAAFHTTHWSVVLAARDRDAPAAHAALAALCTAYWYPVYAFVRRKGHDADQAADLTQEFFARLLETDALASVDPRKGRFRSFLLAACSHFLANWHDRRRAAKRGGGRAPIAIEVRAAEDRYRLEPAHHTTPERLFEQRWALALLERVFDRLGQEYRDAGKVALFEALKATLAGDPDAAPYAALARQLGLTERAVQMAVYRLRGRYGQILRELIAETVADPSEVDEEIRLLFAALRP
jgi:RNA polymerase sigma-70 factor (ECF subfamily)